MGGNKKNQSENLQGTHHFEEVDIEGRITLQQDRQCTYNVPSRCIRLTIVAVETAVSIKYSECVFIFLPSISSMPSACAEYIVICGLSGSTVFFHISHKGHNFFRGGGIY